MKKIILIEPKTKKGHVYSTTRMPRLGLPLLGTQLKEAGYDVSIHVNQSEALPWPKLLEADLVGISTTTSTSHEAYRIAGYLHSQNVPIIIGGIHATFLPEEALQYADYVVRGEADLTFLSLIRSLDEGKSPEDIPGISYWQNGEAVHNPLPEDWIDVEQLPMPDLTLLDHYNQMRSIPIMTSRGCPYNCIFCSVAPMFGRSYRSRSKEKILQELSLYKGKSIFFCDDNFTANPKHTKQVLQEMLDRNIKLKSWGAQMRVESAKDEEFLELMRRTGGDIAYVGLESINPLTLQSYNKKQNVDDIRKCIRKFHEYGIRIHGMFVFGSDQDTVDTIQETVDFALEMRIDSVQFMILTPLPGTPLFEKLESEGRLLTKDWELYDGHHVVFQPAQMSAEELQKETIKAFRRFYTIRNAFQNFFLTGWGSALYRCVGWWLVKNFDKQSRWYQNILAQLQNKSDSTRAVPLLYRRIQVSKQGNLGTAAGNLLKVYVSENNGVFYLRLRGLLNRFALQELRHVLKNLLPQRCFHLVVNAEGLHLSEKVIKNFALFLKQLGKRVNRLQLIYSPKESRQPFLRKYFPKFPRFELLMSRR
ncbi:MAG: B12-binding domain-containing radical SAM protein [Firmicutes bacterium]|nr:B12-binding domain-containing radical SAM protein [Bacillota bacterium]